MKQTLAFFLLFLVSAVSQAQEKYMEHDADGRLRVLGYIDKKTGKREGHWVTYGQNGLKTSEGDYKNGEKEGRHYKYDDEGRVYIAETYRNGLLNGPWLQYHNTPDKKGNLPLYARSYYCDGRQEGMGYVYEWDGRISHKSRYKDGMMMADTSYVGDKVYYTSMHRVTDPSWPTGYYYKKIVESAPYKPKATSRSQSRAVSQRKPQSKPKQVGVAPKRTKKRVAPKRTKVQNIPSFIKIQNTPAPAKTSKLKVGKDGSIQLE